MYHLSSIPLVSLTGNTCPPFQEGLPMASRHGAIMGWAERVEGRPRIEKHRVLSVAMTDAIIGCPHQEGMDYEGEWCPVCEFGTDEIVLRGRGSTNFVPIRRR